MPPSLLTCRCSKQPSLETPSFQAHHFHTLSISPPVTGDSGSQCWPTAMQSHSVYLFVIIAFPLLGQTETNQSSVRMTGSQTRHTDDYLFVSSVK